MQNDFLHRYFTGILRLRHLLQAEESIEQGMKKVPAPQRFLWALPLLAFGAALVGELLLPFVRDKKAKQERKKRFPYT